MRKTGKVAQPTPEEIRQRRMEQARAIKGDGFLFSGNRQQCVPADLLLDRRLTPLERNTWQVFRLLLNEDGLTAFPTYEELRKYLSASPGALASPETVSRVLTILRLTRWLSLVRRRRDQLTGRPLGNVYVLHDSPLTPYEAMELDPNYLELLGQSLTSKSKAVGTIVQIVLEEIAQDPALQAKGVPTRLELLQQRLAARDTEASYPQDGSAVDPIVDPKKGLQFCTTESVVPMKAAQNKEVDRLRWGLQQDSTVRSSSIYKKRTTGKNLSTVEAPSENVSTSPASESIRLPQFFTRLRAEEQQGALMALGSLRPDLQQTVLDEWAARCHTDPIRKPANYLFGMVQKAIRGQFNATRCTPDITHRPAPSASPKPSPAPAPQASPEVAREYMSRIRDMLRIQGPPERPKPP